MIHVYSDAVIVKIIVNIDSYFFPAHLNMKDGLKHRHYQHCMLPNVLSVGPGSHVSNS